jgi:hypothetical protein
MTSSPSAAAPPPATTASPARPTRRRLLRYGLGGALLLAGGGIGLSLQRTQLRAAAGPLQVLDAREFSILAAVADRLVPRAGEFPAASEIGVPEKVDALLARMDPGQVGEVRLLLRLLENATLGLVLDGRVRPFTRCSAAVQDRVLANWRDGAIQVRRVGYKALNGLCQSAYWASPEIYPLVGYPGPRDFRGDAA